MRKSALLTVQEHTSSSYAPRTYANALNADLTVAFAVDFTTAGERLTHKAAQARYHAIPLAGEPIVAARSLYRAMRLHNARTLNIAGNGIYTLSQVGSWSQESVSQTGVDIAGVAAAHALGLDALALLPRGYRQRHTDKRDREHSQTEIRAQIEHYAKQLVDGGAAVLR